MGIHEKIDVLSDIEIEKIFGFYLIFSRMIKKQFSCLLLLFIFPESEFLNIIGRPAGSRGYFPRISCQPGGEHYLKTNLERLRLLIKDQKTNEIDRINSRALKYQRKLLYLKSKCPLFVLRRETLTHKNEKKKNTRSMAFLNWFIAASCHSGMIF